jgi:predicted PurR-regulated permease PerM
MTTRFEKPYTFDRVIRMVISLLLIGATIYFIYILRNVLLPFLIAWLIAYLLNPVVNFFQKKLHIKNRFAAVLLTFILLTGLLTSLYIGLSPMVAEEISQINDLITTYRMQSFTINGIPVSVHDFIARHVDFEGLKDAITEDRAAEVIKYLVPAVQGVLSGGISFVLGFTVFFIILLYIIFILLDYDKINQLWMNMVPHKYRPFVSKLRADVEVSMNKYFRHQALICAIVAVLFATSFQIIGLPLAIIIGLLIGVLHMIPYMHLLSLAPVVLMCWLKASQTGQSFWGLIGIIILIYIGIQCIIDMVLVPRIMGKAMGMNPAIILLSLSIWGSLLGIIGMIIAIPMTTLMLSYYQNFIDSEEDIEAETPPDEP